MNKLETAFIQGITAFAATNIDDIIIMMLLFSQVNSHFRRRHILIGQYLGFTAIIIASLPGFFGGLVVRREWIGLLGLLPIIIGIKQLLNSEQENTEIQTVTTDLKQSSPTNPILSFILSVLHPQIYQVAAVTLANGGDNIGIYVPLFASYDLASLGVTLAVFFVMIGIWCGVAELLIRQPIIAHILTRYGQAIVPFILIGLGLFIMYERGTFSLIYRAKI